MAGFQNYMYFYHEIPVAEDMNREQESVDAMTEELVEEEKSLLLINDDHNTFEYVIKSLVEVCDHTYEQAETCAWITHYKGKCAIKYGTFEELKPYYDALLARQLYVSIQ
jgi:ATP-dependent Clp protease adaptor protein ClpS